ncbi:FecR family protein [Paracoccus aminophilus]|uniref:Transmembrane sensor n=1 Tax=Paracoccus aminophilus JCM 7686 TaxID=1367847 RepID=S5XUB0_PARAH|nr:DUF4880 domain-containing protein [Paracoccus aminophilus]AGT08792.1 transmembrane sensor [Paracoccus aminophilus JCM 7686]
MAAFSLTARLLDEAIDLMIRRQTSPDSAVLARQIAAWCAQSPDHARIWARVAEAHGRSGAALGSAFGDAPRALSRRNFLIGGAGLGAASMGALGWPKLRLYLLADHLTTTAELLPLDLPGAGQMTLGPASAIAYLDGADAPGVRLLRGMGWFNLDDLPATAPPFTLRAGEVAIRGRRAAFEASEDAGLVNLAVASGEVQVLAPRLPAPMSLTSGGWLRLNPQGGAIESGQRDASLAGAWQDGLILAEAAPLNVLVARIARWLPGRVVLADSAIARIRVSGVFDMSDPERALDAAVRPTGGKLRRMSSLLTVISSV